MVARDGIEIDKNGFACPIHQILHAAKLHPGDLHNLRDGFLYVGRYFSSGPERHIFGSVGKAVVEAVRNDGGTRLVKNFASEGFQPVDLIRGIGELGIEAPTEI